METQRVSSISGAWELRGMYGGNILPATFPPGNGNLLKCTDSAFQFYENGELVLQGEYQIRKNDTGNDIIVFGNGSMPGDTATLENDTLKLSPAHPDLASRIYARVH